MLATYAIDNGVTHERVSEVMMHYDIEKAWARVPQYFVIAHWAWIDPDAALAVAEADPDKHNRGFLLAEVGMAWAYLRTEQIDRITKNPTDNPFQDYHVRKAAAAELEWRRLGNAPRNTKNKAFPVIDRLGSNSPRRIFGRAGAHPDTLAVLNDPGDTSWLKAPERELRLNEAAEIAYFESGTPRKFWTIIPLLADSTLPDNELNGIARSKALSGSPSEAMVLVARIRSAQQYVWATTSVTEAVLWRGD